MNIIKNEVKSWFGFLLEGGQFTESFSSIDDNLMRATVKHVHRSLPMASSVFTMHLALSLVQSGSSLCDKSHPQAQPYDVSCIHPKQQQQNPQTDKWT